MNSNFSKRLLTIANMIEDGKTVYDVGCDHAYLDIYLTLYRNIKCYAIDVRKSVIDIAKKNINKFNLDIPVILSNGIEKVEISNNSVVVIAGMGTRTILKILKGKKVPELLIQSNDDLPLLRKTLSKWGYKIVDEKIIFENDYYYVFIKFKIGKSKYNDNELLLGPVLMNEKDNCIYIDYLTYLIKKFNKMISNVPEEFASKREQLLLDQTIVREHLNKLK